MMRRAPAFVIGAAILLRSAAGLWLGFRPFDDTYITFRYSLNLASGHGFVYNIGEPVLGTTSPLWAIVLALSAAAGASIESAALAISLTCDALSSVLLFTLLTALGFTAGIPLAGSVLFLAFADYFSLARSGMESSFFVFLVIGALASMSSRRFVMAAVFTALSVLTRPEGALLLMLLPAAAWRHRTELRRHETAAAVSMMLLIVGGWALYATLTFGSVVPQSVVAKSAMFKDPALAQFSWNNIALFFLKGQYGGEIFSRTYLQLMPALTLLAAAGAVFLLTGFRRNPDQTITRAALLLFFPSAYVAGMAMSHAFTYFPWYYAPIYPFIAALAAVGAAAITRSRPQAVALVTAALVAAQAAAVVFVKLPADKANFWIAGYFDVSEDVPRRPSITVAAPEIGAVGWRVWPAAVLDLEGLVTPDVVGVPAEKFLNRKRPDYLVLRTDNGAALLESLQAGEWFIESYALTSVRRDPYAAREFRTYKRKPVAGSQ